MSFYDKYERERLIGDGEIKTFRASGNARGWAVLSLPAIFVPRALVVRKK